MFSLSYLLIRIVWIPTQWIGPGNEIFNLFDQKENFPQNNSSRKYISRKIIAASRGVKNFRCCITT
jgi:hypothetical protein